MQETLEEKAIVALDGIIQTVVQAQEFVLDQAPSVVQELLQWHMIQGVALGSLSIITLIPLIASYLLYLNHFEKIARRHLEHTLGFSLLVATIFQLVFSSVGFCGFVTAAKVILAPKLYLIEYAAQLL